mmetsp:Transcript_69231/g.206100  ORF Transcript_69231/g.206100 Transcript_69231/m.206100 type:complete len:365 (-) Transcript_69231:99-1193(-)
MVNRFRRAANRRATAARPWQHAEGAEAADEALHRALAASRETADLAARQERELTQALARSLADQQHEEHELAEVAEAAKLSKAARHSEELGEEALALALALSAADGASSSTGPAAIAEGSRERLAEAAQHRVMAEVLESSIPRTSPECFRAEDAEDEEGVEALAAAIQASMADARVEALEPPGAAVLAEDAEGEEEVEALAAALAASLADAEAEAPEPPAATVLAEDAEDEEEAEALAAAIAASMADAEAEAERKGVSSTAASVVAHRSLAEDDGAEESAAKADIGVPDALDRWWCVAEGDEAAEAVQDGAEEGSAAEEEYQFDNIEPLSACLAEEEDEAANKEVEEDDDEWLDVGTADTVGGL